MISKKIIIGGKTVSTFEDDLKNKSVLSLQYYKLSLNFWCYFRISMPLKDEAYISSLHLGCLYDLLFLTKGNRNKYEWVLNLALEKAEGANFSLRVLDYYDRCWTTCRRRAQPATFPAPLEEVQSTCGEPRWVSQPRLKALVKATSSDTPDNPTEAEVHQLTLDSPENGDK